MGEVNLHKTCFETAVLQSLFITLYKFAKYIILWKSVLLCDHSSKLSVSFQFSCQCMFILYEMAMSFLMNAFYEYIPVVRAVQSEEKNADKGLN